MTDQSSKTPRTDAASVVCYGEGGIEQSIGFRAVPLKDARTLELEAADLHERLAKARAIAEDRQRIYRDAYYRALSSLGSFDAALQTHIAKQVADTLRALTQKGADHE